MDHNDALELIKAVHSIQNQMAWSTIAIVVMLTGIALRIGTK